MMSRKFAPGEYDGERVEFATAAQRRALIGKKIGYDTRRSCMKGFGTVTDAHGRSIEINHNWYDKRDIEQIVVLSNQN